MKNILGWSSIRLDQRCKISLTSLNAEFGLRTESLMVDGDGSLVSQFTTNISIETSLKLIFNKVKLLVTLTNYFHSLILNYKSVLKKLLLILNH